jgi:hypothetical protein
LGSERVKGKKKRRCVGVKPSELILIDAERLRLRLAEAGK